MSNTQKVAPPKTAKKPADRKPKDVVNDLKADASENAPFPFEANGKTYTLPPASEALLELDGGDLMDILESDEGELRLGIRVLRMSNIDDETMTALRSKKLVDFSRTVGDWMRSAKLDLGE